MTTIEETIQPYIPIIPEVYKLADSDDIEDLKKALQFAIELEHATMPPYLYAYYSLINEDDNKEVRDLIFGVVIDEMQHMLLAGNLLKSIGGSPKIDDPHFVPNYPSALPGSVATEFKVNLKKYSGDHVEKDFLRIEQPEHIIPIPVRAQGIADEPSRTIGEFYGRIRKRFEDGGDKLIQDTTGDLQPTTFFDDLTEDQQKITSAQKAKDAIDFIIEQGEGNSTNPLDPNTDEPAHYYRFAQLVHGRLERDETVPDDQEPHKKYYYNSNDQITIGTVRDFPDNPKMADYDADSSDYGLLEKFNRRYTKMLNLLHQAWNPPANSDDTPSDILDDAISQMGRMDSAAKQLANKNLGPTFEYLADSTPDPSPPTGDPMSNSTPEQNFIQLIRRLRDDENAARRHRRIEYEAENRTLADLFDESLERNENLALLLTALKEKNSVREDTDGRKLVVAGNPNESLLFSIITPDSDDEIRSMSRNFNDEDREVVRQWILSLADGEVPTELPPPRTK